MKNFKVGDFITYRSAYSEHEVQKIIKINRKHSSILYVKIGYIQTNYLSKYLTSENWNLATPKEIADALAERLKG